MTTPKHIPLSTLEEITNKFSVDLRIGMGEFADVYKGVYNGRDIAVKLVHVDTVRGLDDQQFKNEVGILWRAKHKNIVQFVGYCYETRKIYVDHNGVDNFFEHIYRVICFDYLHGGSLEKRLHDQSFAPDWSTRYNVIKGICEGLNFLHKSVPQILHLDLKPANILLDSCMEPKVADLGLSRLFTQSHTHVTEKIVGTRKYMPPEFINEGMISPKNDIFSLGVVMIEIMKGPARHSNSFEMGDLAQLMQQALPNWSTVIEATSKYPLEEIDQVTACMRLAICCVDSERNNRPSIEDILDTLNMTEANIPKKKADWKAEAPAIFGVTTSLRGIKIKETRKQGQGSKSAQMSSKAPANTSAKPAGAYHPPQFKQSLALQDKVEGGPGSSMGMADITMDASRDRVDIQSASGVVENIILDENMVPTKVSLAFLQRITENFADNRKIGEGGFGIVYKGHLQNGIVAVKRLSNAHTINEELFYHEATCLIGVKHTNIVRFIGYCANTENEFMANPNQEEITRYIPSEIRERLLCFEYIKNGSLDRYLTDELRGLEWDTRYKIIKGICKGLDYLHIEKGIIHRDLKPANILVDDLMVPKITDFGISKFLKGETHDVTSNSAMSFGYTAPEFIHQHVVSFKSDMYSLGVIIVDLVTGRKGNPDIENVLRRWRHRWNKSGKYPPFGYQQVTKCIEIASKCLSGSRNKRPSARDVLSMLNATESMDVQIAVESPVGPIRPYPWELLEFDKLELNFPFEVNKQIPCSMELTNVTDDYTAFDIQMPEMLEYSIKPNKGVVPARSKCIVTVTLQARQVVPYVTMCKDEIVVRCAAVSEGLTAKEIHEDMFNKEKSGKCVDEVMLTVVVQRRTIN